MKTVIIMIFLLSLSACSTVHPWQKADLARLDMAWDADSQLNAFRNHIYFSKEGSSSDTHSAGGGCGCN